MVSPTTREVVLVTGATGRIGRLVVDELLRVGASVRALTRRPEQAALPAGVEVVPGDFTVPASLNAARATLPSVIAELAARSRRVVYLSAPYRTPHPFFQQPNPMRDLHAEVERLLAVTGLEVAIVRPGMVASNALHWWAPQIRVGNVIRWPYATVETAPVDERDVAAVAARALLDGRHAGGDYVLTGPESLSHAAQVHAIGDAIGHPLQVEELSPDEFRRHTAGVWPAGVADMLLAAWGASIGRPAFVTSAVEEVLGSPPRTFFRWAVDHASAFGSSRTASSKVRATYLTPQQGVGR